MGKRREVRLPWAVAQGKELREQLRTYGGGTRHLWEIRGECSGLVIKHRAFLNGRPVEVVTQYVRDSMGGGVDTSVYVNPRWIATPDIPQLKLMNFSWDTKECAVGPRFCWL